MDEEEGEMELDSDDDAGVPESKPLAADSDEEIGDADEVADEDIETNIVDKRDAAI